eukprot:2106534-Pleurochrysis_carterae.AAC.1
MRPSTGAGKTAGCSLTATGWYSMGGRGGRTLTGTNTFCRGMGTVGSSRLTYGWQQRCGRGGRIRAGERETLLRK